jgi:multiple sugar transport system ATP-binding protein
MTLADRIVVLRAGRVEQVGSPMELYNNPANTFVAGFIGSPQMNFLDAASLGLAPGQVGIRPEHLSIARDAGDLPAEVSHIEKLGGETLVYARHDTHGLLTVRLFGEHDYTVSEKVFLSPLRDRMFQFNPDGQRR